MRARSLISLFAAFLALSACAIPGPSEHLNGDEGQLARLTQSPFFIQMADPQLGFAGTPLLLVLLGYTWNDDPTAQEIALFEKAIEHANRLRPAFVVICGDLIQTPGHAGQTREFQRIAGRLDTSIPLHLVPGNHDVAGEPTPDLLRSFRRDFGPDWYSFRHGDVYGIVLNSSLIGQPSKAPGEAAAQFAWLKGELGTARASGAAQILVFQHHSFFLNDPDEAYEYFNLPNEIRGQYLKLLHEAGVKAVFAGHYHRNAYGRDGELEMITTGPVGKPLGDDPSGFRIVRIGEDGFEHAYFGIADGP